MAKGNGGQMSLVPPRQLKQELVALEVDEVVGKGRGKVKVLGPPPDLSFVESVRMMGVLDPIKLQRTGKGWKMEDGFRRLQAVLILRDREPPEDWGQSLEEWRALWSTIPAFVVEADGWHDGLLSLTLNEQRSDNLAVLLVYVERLAAEGFSEHDIYEATGVPIARIRRVLSLTNLDPKLRAAFMAGDIVNRVAEAAAKCSAEQQEQLVEIFEKEGQLTASDVREVKKADARAAQAALAGMGADDAGNWWIDEVRRKLGECLAVVPQDEEIRTALQAVVDELDERESGNPNSGGTAEYGGEALQDGDRLEETAVVTSSTEPVE